MSTTADFKRLCALRTELATILGYPAPSRSPLVHVGVVDVGPQRLLGCELYRDGLPATGELYAVGFADHEARSVYRVSGVPEVGYWRDVALLEVVYDAERVREIVAAFAAAAGGGGRPEVRRRALAELARALGGAPELVIEMAEAIAGGERGGA